MKTTSILIIAIALCAVNLSVQSPKDDCPRIKTKQMWHGEPAKYVTYQTIPISYVIIHHTVTNKCTNFLECQSLLQNIQTHHFKLKFDDIGYNFLIGNDGNVYEGCGWHKIGAHSYGYNRNGTGIAFIGDFSSELPTKKALSAAKKLLKCGVSLGELAPDYRLLGGRQVIATNSPGDPIYEEIQKWSNWADGP